MDVISFWLLVLLAAVFLTTSVGVLVIANYTPPPWLDKITAVVYSVHLFCWMVLGMLANGVWDQYQHGLPATGLDKAKILIPILVSPIVFFSVWALVVSRGEMKKDNISIVWPLIAFQNGFFWQVIFSKAAPVVRDAATAATTAGTGP